MNPDRASRIHERSRISVPALLLLVCVPLVSLMARGGVRPTREQDPVVRYLERYEEIVMDPAQAARSVRTTGRLLVVTPGDAFEVVLEPHDVRAGDYRAEDESSDNVTRALARGESRTYRGTSPTLANSEARFSVSDDTVEGVIITPEEWYFVEPRRNFAPGSARNRFVVYRRSDVRPDSFGTCATSMAERIGAAMTLPGPAPLMASGSVYVADVATEADYEYVTASGGADAADSAILGVMNQVDGIYQTQLGISLRVVYQHTWSNPGDPYTSTAPSNMLTEFRNYWNGNYYSVPFDLAHMWTGKDMDGSAIGIAYLGTVCGARTYSYGISQRFSASPGKYILTAHEIGHNFGAGHSDTSECANTIMNSYIGGSTAFCSVSKDEVAAYLSANHACLADGPGAPTAPSGLTAATLSSSQINLSWQDNSPDETGFRVERKTGSGGTYALLATAAADATQYSNTGLTAGTIYYYRVQAVTASAKSTWSNEASATTPAQPPAITGMLPAAGAAESSVTITGTGFAGATAVRFNGVNAASFTVSSPSQIVGTVPSAASTGLISVTTPGGTAQSASDFVVINCTYSVTPLSASVGPAAIDEIATVTTGAECGWTASSSAAWVTVTSGSAGTGSGAVRFRVAANSGGSVRSGTLTVAAQTLRVTQSGSGCDLNVDGILNVLDIQALINRMLGIGPAADLYDLNRDGKVDVLDLQRLVNSILGVTSCP